MNMALHSTTWIALIDDKPLDSPWWYQAVGGDNPVLK